MGNTQSYNIIFSLSTDISSTTLYLLNSENRDRYFEECNSSPKNVKARKGEVVYSGNNISPVETKYIVSYLESVSSILPKRLMNDLGKVRIIQLMPTSEGGMPHTRPGDSSSIDGIICFPNISQLYSNTTLIHELWHIHQRKYKDLWSVVFKKQGWQEWDGDLPDELEENRRYNPDTIDCPLWIFQDKWIPIPIFHDISNPKVGEVDIWFYNSEKRTRTRNIPGELLSYYSDSLPSVAFEHPREIAAYLLSEPQKYENSRGFKDLIKDIGIISLPDSYINREDNYRYKNYI